MNIQSWFSLGFMFHHPRLSQDGKTFFVAISDSCQLFFPGYFLCTSLIIPPGVSQRVGHDWATELNWIDSFRRWASLQPICHLGRNILPSSSGFVSLFFFLVLPVYCYQPISLHPRAHMLSHVIPRTSARQTLLSMDFSRQEYWSRLPFPSPRVCLFIF